MDPNPCLQPWCAGFVLSTLGVTDVTIDSVSFQDSNARAAGGRRPRLVPPWQLGNQTSVSCKSYGFCFLNFGHVQCCWPSQSRPALTRSDNVLNCRRPPHMWSAQPTAAHQPSPTNRCPVNLCRRHSLVKR
eukprot:358601-Chlamydomonas_euryale.AAC.1